MGIDIRRVTTASELFHVFQFRYGVYVEEMAKLQRHADHLLRIVREPMDDTAIILGAFKGGRVVGTVRTNRVRDGIGDYFELHRLNEFDARILDSAVITTKLLVAPDLRASIAGLGMRLSIAAFRVAYESGIRYSFCDCNPIPTDNTQFFVKMGYRQIMPKFDHPEYGPSTPMFMCLADIEHLREVGSPFARIVEECGLDPESLDVFRQWYERWHAWRPCGRPAPDRLELPTQEIAL